MEPYIQISQLNDFVFCPKSIYFHNLYRSFNQQIYHTVYQKTGQINHEAIEEKRYSSQKRYLQGLSVYSDEYGICGKIDIYDIDDKVLIERKTKISQIYDGQKYQMYGQYFALKDMGYDVFKMILYSKSDNKKYEIPLPNQDDIDKFSSLISDMHSFSIENKNFVPNINKCEKCIYKYLCDSF